MTNKRNPLRKGRDASRDHGPFVALPWTVLDSPAFAQLPHPARSLLLEIARQYCGDNNGRLLASFAYLEKRGWTSRDVIARAKKDLLDAGFIYETVKGHRPNKASWYAVTWYALAKIKGYDFGAEEDFKRGAYSKGLPDAVTKRLTREQLYEKHRAAGKTGAEKITSSSPSAGTGGAAIVPSAGTVSPPAIPSGGTILATIRTSLSPSDGNHLEMPSPKASLPATASTGDCSTPAMPDWLQSMCGCNSPVVCVDESRPDKQMLLESFVTVDEHEYVELEV